jgi:hypothetical protein
MEKNIMRKEYLVSLLFLVAIVISGVYADPFAINYYVNTDSSQEYLNIQYGNYYDNVSLRLRLQAMPGYSNVPVVVSPKVYGLDSYGNLTYLYSVPSQTYYSYSTPYEYVYPNVFYLTPDYYGYVVKVYAEATGYYYNTYSYAYVYPVNNAPYYYFIEDTPTDDDFDFPQNTTPDCSDIVLSGTQDIYLDESESDTYSFYIENEANEDLEIVDVYTSDPAKLDIDDIDYPDEVPDLSVRTVRMDIEADSVSDDYDSVFTITVKARYPNSSICTKTYEVEYHISEEDNDDDDDDEEDVSCSDLDITNTRFTINDDETSTRKIKLENDSDDYDFEIDDITISDRDGLDVSIEDWPDEIDSDDYEYLEIELDADDFDYDITKYLTLEIDGAFVDDDDDEIKECTRKATITVKIEDDGDNDDDDDDDDYETSCDDVSLYTMNISQAENSTDYFSEDDGFYILNNSDRTFTITSLSLNDNSSFVSISNLNYAKTITSGNTSSLNFTLKTINVSTTEYSRGTLSVAGRFSDGRTCSSSKIGVKYFDISVNNSTSGTNNGSTNNNNNFSGSSCSIDIIAPSTVSVNNSQESINVSFKNYTSRNGRVEISSNGLTTNPSVIFLSGFDNFSQNINLSNFNNPTSITYTAYLNGCSSKSTFTNIINNISESDRVTLVSYPTFISPTSNNTKISVNINNSFNVSKEVTLKLAGFPNNFGSSPKTITLSSHQTKQVDLDLIIPENAQKIDYQAYIELYSGSLLVNKYPITISLSPAISEITIISSSKQSSSQDRTYTITLTLRNNTNNIQEGVVDFGLSETYVIDGEKNIYLLPNEEITKIYKVVSPTRLREDKVLDIKIKDKATGKELANEKLTLDSGRSPLSAFLTLRNAGFILLGIVVLIVLFLVFRKR